MAGATFDYSLNRNLHFLFGKWLLRLSLKLNGLRWTLLGKKKVLLMRRTEQGEGVVDKRE